MGGTRPIAEGVDPHMGEALAAKGQHIGRMRRHVDDAPADEGPAIVDHEDGRTAILEVGDFHRRPEGKGAVCCRHAGAMELCAARRLVT